MSCRVEACDKPIHVKKEGLCNPHYQRQRKYGDPIAPRPKYPSRAGALNSNWRGGATAHPLYLVYSEIIARCSREDHARWGSYGGRGIEVCARWRSSFWNFVEDMGARPEGVGPTGRSLFSVERIDNDGNYEPGNCKWGTYSEQSRNRRHGAWEGRPRGREGRYIRKLETS